MLQYSTLLRNAQLAAIASTVGAAPQMRFYSAAESANCAASAPSGLLATLSLPSTFEGSPTGGVIALANGPWTGNATATGTIASWRLYDSTGTTCHAQGSVTSTGGGGDMTFDNPAIVSGQNLQISSFSITAGNA